MKWYHQKNQEFLGPRFYFFDFVGDIYPPSLSRISIFVKFHDEEAGFDHVNVISFSFSFKQFMIFWVAFIVRLVQTNFSCWGLIM